MRTETELSENWRPVVGWEGFYEVSDCGRVRSVARNFMRKDLRHVVHYTGRLLVQIPKSNGYVCTELKRQGETKRFYIHQLVAVAFIGPCPIGKEVNHIDHNRSHNSVKNLEYLLRSKNRGEFGNRRAAKLRIDELPEIRRLYLEGVSQKRIGELFGVTQSAISLITKKGRVKL